MPLSKKNPTKQEFENFYEKSNPWNADGIFSDLVRQRILRKVFANKAFDRGIDIACGEGYVTSRLNFVKDKFGVDISETAVNRARKKYKNVCFVSGDAFKNKVIDGEFDFISCFEALYYPTLDEERKNALRNLLNYGSNKSIYTYSVVTIGENKHRRYFTKKEFIEMLIEVGYKVDGVYGFVLGGKHSSVTFRIIRKAISILLPRSLSESLYAFITMNASDSNIYQHLFVCRKN